MGIVNNSTKNPKKYVALLAFAYKRLANTWHKLSKRHKRDEHAQRYNNKNISLCCLLRLLKKIYRQRIATSIACPFLRKCFFLSYLIPFKEYINRSHKNSYQMEILKTIFLDFPKMPLCILYLWYICVLTPALSQGNTVSSLLNSTYKGHKYHPLSESMIP